MTIKEAIKRLRQKTCPATYMPDFDKEECLKVIEKELEIFDSTGYEADDVFMAITNKNTIHFCGDAYYGEYSKDDWLKFIKECIDAYKKLN